MSTEVAVLTLNKSSQATIPKSVREILGVELGDRLAVRLTSRKNEVVISREPSFAERMDAVRAKWNAKLTKEKLAEREQLVRKNRGKTAAELRAEWDNSPEGRAYYAEKFTERTA